MRIGMNLRYDLKLEGQGHSCICECGQKPIVISCSITKPIPAFIKGNTRNYNEINFCQIDRARRNRLQNPPCTGGYVFFKISYLKECEIFPFYFWKDYPLAGG